jgi:hypothetical protein
MTVKITRHANPPPPASRPIKTFPQAPSRAQPVRPPSEGGTKTSEETIRRAKRPGEIDPKQMHN